MTTPYYQLTPLERECLFLGDDGEVGEESGYPERQHETGPVEWRSYLQVGETRRVWEC